MTAMTPSPEELLDRCIDAARAGRDPEEILAKHPELADDIRPLLAIATDLAGLPAPSTSVRGLMAALARATAEQEAAAAQPPRRRVRWFSRSVLLRAAAMLLAVLLIGWGSVSASASAVPGDWLYPIKLFTERAKFILTVNPEDKAELRITFSEERLKEAVEKHQRGGGIDKELLQAMLDEAKAALDVAPGLPDASRRLLLSRAAYLSQFQRKTLKDLEKRAAPEERKTLAPFMDACMRRCNWMRKRGTDDEGPPSPDSSSEKSKRKAANPCECPMCQ